MIQQFSKLLYLALRIQLTLALALGLLAAGTHAAQQPAEGETSLVLLENGNVLQGTVRVVDGHYLVSNEGSEIRLRPDRVAHVAASIQDHYAWKRSRLAKPTLGDRLDLAEWCMQHQLWGEASRELLEVRSRDPRNRRVGHVERRLQQAWRLANAKPAPVDPRRQASQELANEIAEAAEAAQQLRLIETLPEGSLEQFTRRIQPILVNNCTTAGCHQPGGDQSFQLNRDILHGFADRRSTFANLASVLAAIDRENPGASPLLSAGNQPHAGKAMGVLNGRRGELNERLASWVEGLNGPGIATRRPRQPQPVRQAMFATPIGGGFQQPAAAAYQEYSPRRGPSPRGLAVPENAQPMPYRPPAAPASQAPHGRQGSFAQQGPFAQQAQYLEDATPHAGSHPSGVQPQFGPPGERPASGDPRLRPDYYEQLQQKRANPAPAGPSHSAPPPGNPSAKQLRPMPGNPPANSAVNSPVTARVPVQYGAQANPSAVRDEFDPEIFNQQFRKKKQDESR